MLPVFLHLNHKTFDSRRQLVVHNSRRPLIIAHDVIVRGSSAVECRTRNQVSPGSNPPLVPFRRLGIFVLSINAPVDSAV